MAEIRTIDFNNLPRTTRERFIAITKNLAGPPPIFSNRTGGGGALAGWIVLLVISLLAGLFILFAGFGSPYHATQDLFFIVIYLAIGFFIFLSIGGMIRRVRMNKVLPFQTGVYVFPMDTVIARDRMFKIIPAGELTSLQPAHHYRNGVYMNTSFTFRYSDGTSEYFSVYGQAAAQTMLERLKSAGGQVDDAIARRDVGALQQLDPFFDARMSGWQPAPDPQGPQAGSIPGWMKYASLLGLAGGLLTGPLFYVVRNLASDHSAYTKCKAIAEKSGSGTGSSYYYYSSTWELEAYTRHGWLHKDEVQNELLPRAKLNDAKAKTGIDERITEIQKVIDEYPTASCKAEMDAAMKDALHAAYTDAKDKNTVAALRDFQKKYPKAEDVGAAKTRIHELFTKTLTDFRPRASTTDKDMIPFVESLLQYMEKNDSPPMEVRFSRHNSPTLAAADKILASDPETGDLAGASSHFDAAHEAPREQAVVEGMKKGFASVFPADVLPLVKGADLPTSGKALPTLSKPTILVDYTVGWSGSTYVDRTAGRSFVGIIFDFDVTMTTPNDPRVLKLKFSVRPPQRFTVNYSTFNDPGMSALLKEGPSDSAVYDVMALRAFDELGSKVQEKFFQKKVAPKKTLDDDEDDD